MKIYKEHVMADINGNTENKANAQSGGVKKGESAQQQQARKQAEQYAKQQAEQLAQQHA